MEEVTKSLGANWRTVLLALIVVSLACAPVSWIDDGFTPSWIIYPLILLVGLWRMWRGHSTLYFGTAGTIFLLVHIPYTPVQWLITLFAVPLLTVIAGFLAWRDARQGRRRSERPRRASLD